MVLCISIIIFKGGGWIERNFKVKIKKNNIIIFKQKFIFKLKIKFINFQTKILNFWQNLFKQISHTKNLSQIIKILFINLYNLIWIFNYIFVWYLWYYFI